MNRFQTNANVEIITGKVITGVKESNKEKFENANMNVYIQIGSIHPDCVS